MKYMFLLYGDEAIGETPSRFSDERAAQWSEFHELAKAAGKLVSWHTLVPTDSARTVRPQEGKLVETDGPFTETKEQLGGVYILECTDMNDAMSFASKMPCALHGSVEVRQMLEE